MPLDQVIPGLFGGSLNTTIDQSGTDFSEQSPRIVSRFRDLSAQLSVARSQVPLPSASGAFSFAWDSDLDTFVRFEQSLGSGFAERAQTIGKGRYNVGMSYQRVNFSTLDGDSLGNITSSQPAFSDSYFDGLPERDKLIYGDDILKTSLNLSFSFDLFYLSAAYGLTDDIDVSLALAINHAHMQGSALAETLDPKGNGGLFNVATFSPNQPGRIEAGQGAVCSLPFRCARDTFDEHATGTGDLYLRAKWHLVDTKWADLAVAQVLTLPTGNADNFLGFNDPTWTPWFIASKNFGRVSPHVNLGYSFRSSQDVSQAQWIAGSDFLVADWMTVAADFLGYHDDKRDGLNDDVIQSGVGFKFNPWGGLVLTASFQFPVNRDGIRADVIYTGQAEYNF
ncbi:MAG: hypothetical protein SF182_07820 [Deltaproteobacteria bacterium]|nr:hypothetical protein [Deltaproteobacteria bacterium]